MGRFTTEEHGKIMRISGPVSLEATAAKEFNDQAKAWLLKPTMHFVLDLKGVAQLTRDFYQAMILLKTTLKKDQKSLYSINVSDGIMKQLRTDGVLQVFTPIEGIEKIPAEEGVTAKGASFNVEFINPFLAATQKTLDVQCKTKTSPKTPFLKKESMPNMAIVGVLSLASKSFNGSIVLCFPQTVFLKIYENMFGEKHEKISAEMEDAAAELLNIIYGQAKIELNSKGYDFQKALPTVMTGDKMSVRHSGARPAVVIPFETDFGLFHVEIEFNKNHEAAA
jgi:chemotaxis protein CheX